MLNAVTHGLGLVLSLLGAPALVRRACAAALPGDGARGVLAAALYSFSLCLLYLSSTCYHSGFRLTRKQRLLLQASRDFPRFSPRPSRPALPRRPQGPHG